MLLFSSSGHPLDMELEYFCSKSCNDIAEVIFASSLTRLRKSHLLSVCQNRVKAHYASFESQSYVDSVIRADLEVNASISASAVAIADCMMSCCGIRFISSSDSTSDASAV